MSQKKIRGFEVVRKDARTAFDVLTDEKRKKHFIEIDIQLPKRADNRSAGYDLYAPKDMMILPMHKEILYTDVKAYMQDDEVLKLYIRSSLAIKKGLMLSNNVGIVDSSYYNNESNDGNIGIPLVNTSGVAVKIAKGERVAQAIFVKYLTADADEVLSDKRTGGVGSSGE